MNECSDEYEFPAKIYNRPGLDRIRYRIGRYPEFRKYLLQKITRSQLFKGWTHHSPDDPAFALLEGACILCDILTFYQELYANEVYLRTAKQKESIADLVRLVGYRSAPGLGGKTTFAVEVKGDKPVVIPSNLSIKADIEGIEQPVIFQTKEECICYPGLNKFYLFPPLLSSLISGSTTEFYVDNPEISLQDGDKIEPGDKILIGVTDSNNQRRIIDAEIIIVDKVRQVRDKTVLTIKGKLKRTKSSELVIGFKLKNAYQHFGYNAPPKIITVKDNVTSEKKISYMLNIQKQREFLLDSEIKDLPLGSTLLIQGFFLPTYFKSYMNRRTLTLIRRVNNIRPSSSTWKDVISGPTTLITIDEKLDTITKKASFTTIDIRKIQFYEVAGQQFILKALEKHISSEKGNTFYYYGFSESEISKLEGRILTVIPREKNEPIIVRVLSVDKGHHSLQIDKDLDYKDFPNEIPTTEIYGNLVAADQGKSEIEILGSGDNRQEFQTFKLPKSPLTYFKSGNETPPEVPELKIFVNDQLWKMVSSFFDNAPCDKIYVVHQDVNGNSWVQFGNGKTGARLPSGLDNIRAEYRVGIGASGALKSDGSIKPLQKGDLIDEVRMFSKISGGYKPEDDRKAKDTAPGKIRSLGRLVGLDDYEVETLSIAGVLKASATLLLEGGETPTIVIKVIVDSHGEIMSKEISSVLHNYDKCRGSQRFPINVVIGKFQYVYIEMEYGIDPNARKEIVEDKIREYLGVFGGNNINELKIESEGMFGFRSRRFGQEEYSTTVEGSAQNIQGILWTRVTSMYSLGEAEDPEDLALLKTPLLQTKVSCDENHILRLYIRHLVLKDVSTKTIKECA